MITDQKDAYGHMLDDYMQGKNVMEIIEREDGYIDFSLGPKVYFSEYETWPDFEKQVMALAQGRVLDIGGGAGRHALYLQEQGHDVVAIDNSPLAVDVMRRRGVKDARLLSVTQISPELGTFDTILMMGNNFGLMSNPKRAKWLLRRMKNITSPTARIIAMNRDPYATDNPVHTNYHEQNRQRGRMGGQIRMRVRHKQYIGEWFDYLFVSDAEMQEILDGTGWHIAKKTEDGIGLYLAVMEKV